MPRFLIDVNLPCRFSLWSGDEYVHVRNLNDEWTDSQIWEYARQRDMVIVSKDSDFSDRVMMSYPPPRVVHVCLGNMKIRAFHAVLTRAWPWVEENVAQFRLIRLYADRAEGIV
jgi:predicted nuclease of predicted toxin-antitoxin system